MHENNDTDAETSRLESRDGLSWAEMCWAQQSRGKVIKILLILENVNIAYQSKYADTAVELLPASVFVIIAAAAAAASGIAMFMCSALHFWKMYLKYFRW